MVEIIVREPLISFKLYNVTEGLKKHEHENHNKVVLNEFDSYMNNDNYYSIEDESPLNDLSEPPQDAHPSMKNDVLIQLSRQHLSPSLDCLCFLMFLVFIIFIFLMFLSVFPYIFVNVWHVCLILICLYLHKLYYFTRACHAIAHGTTSQRSRIVYRAIYVFMYALYMNICSISSHAYRDCIYNVYNYTSSTVYIVLYPVSTVPIPSPRSGVSTTHYPHSTIPILRVRTQNS